MTNFYERRRLLQTHTNIVITKGVSIILFVFLFTWRNSDSPSYIISSRGRPLLLSAWLSIPLEGDPTHICRPVCDICPGHQKVHVSFPPNEAAWDRACRILKQRRFQLCMHMQQLSCRKKPERAVGMEGVQLISIQCCVPRSAFQRSALTNSSLLAHLTPS